MKPPTCPTRAQFAVLQGIRQGTHRTMKRARELATNAVIGRMVRYGWMCAHQDTKVEPTGVSFYALTGAGLKALLIGRARHTPDLPVPMDELDHELARLERELRRSRSAGSRVRWQRQIDAVRDKIRERRATFKIETPVELVQGTRADATPEQRKRAQGIMAPFLETGRVPYAGSRSMSPRAETKLATRDELRDRFARVLQDHFTSIRVDRSMWDAAEAVLQLAERMFA